MSPGVLGVASAVDGVWAGAEDVDGWIPRGESEPGACDDAEWLG
ncbi:hypothetical protein [Mycolicibacterium arenosum]|nr:hypothetical protein [Mycolicibacterium sp. CAU 1645]